MRGRWKRAKETVAWAEQQHREAAKRRKEEREAAEAAERIANGGRR